MDCSSILREIESALHRNQTITVESLPDRSIHIKPLGILSRLWHWRDSRFHEERYSGLASLVAKVIASQQRQSIAAASKDIHLKQARNILKNLRMHTRTLAIENLKKEITAAKLGITASALDRNPGLQAFAEMHHLERYLLIYNDSVQVDSTTQQVSLKKNGQFHSWESLSEDMKTWPKQTRSPQWAWVYGQDGVHNRDLYDWTELKPFIKGNPAEWNHQYVFEFCACFNPDSVKNGNHSWLRLKTPEGDIYSVGLYRPGKASLWDNVKMPLRIKPGYLMQPDVSEFWDFSISTVDFAITKEDFLKIKATIEADKKNEDLVFQIFNNNCLLYSKKLAEIAGVDLPTAEPICHLFVSPSLQCTVSTFIEKLPTCIQKICKIVAAFFLNVAQMFLGACRIDQDLNEQQRRRAVPHLQTMWDLCDINKIYLNHPNTLAFKIRPQVSEWRTQQLTQLNPSEGSQETRQQREGQIKLSLPADYYLGYKSS